MRAGLVILITLLASWSFGQNDDTVEQKILLSDIYIQFDATQALHDLYNFEFEEAEMQFRWIRQKYPWHPLPHFLLGLSEWWKIMPQIEDTSYDEAFLAYMDTAIVAAENLYDNHPEYKVEAAFFLAAGYGFQARLHSERGAWGKAANEGRKSLKYLSDSKGQHELSPELLLGDGLYNYFAVWIPENYGILKPVLAFFPKGDKELGIQQLRTVAQNAFYTRTEAQVFLMRILAVEEGQKEAGFQIISYLRDLYPNNAYFHRFYLMMLYQMGRTTQMRNVALKVLKNIDEGKFGYEETSGRYASFYLGQYFFARGDMERAREYYELAVGFAEEIQAVESGYYHYSLLRLAKMYAEDEQYELALSNIDKIRDHAKRKSRVHQQAREYQKEIRRLQRG